MIYPQTMQRFFWLIFFFPFLPLFAEVKGAHSQHFAFEGSHVFMERGSKVETDLVKVTQGTMPGKNYDELENSPGTVLLNSKQLNEKMRDANSFSAAFKIFWKDQATWEMRYTGRLNWKKERNIKGSKSLSLSKFFDGVEKEYLYAGLLGEYTLKRTDYLFADHVKALLRSNMYNAEVNYSRHLTPRYVDYFSVSCLVGARFFNIEEKLKLFFTTDENTSLFRIKTFNRVCGPQIGASLEYNPYTTLNWGFDVKGGACFNDARGEILMRDNNNKELIKESSIRDRSFSYFFQFYPFIEFRPAKFFTFSVRYQGIYMGGLALADKQDMSAKKSDEINRKGNLFYQGVISSIQLNF